MYVRNHDRFPCTHERGAVRLLVLFAACVLTGFGLLIFGGYEAGFYTVNRIGPLLPEPAWQALTLAGDAMSLCAIVLLLARRYSQLAWAAAIALVLSIFVTRAFKLLFAMPRPPAELDPGSFFATGPAWMAHSFPSGHTLAAALIAGIWIYYSQRFWAIFPAIAFIAAIGISRTVVGVHWPVDTLFGAAIGLLCGWSGIVIARNWRWGLKHLGHAVVIGLLLIASSGLFIEDGGYTQGIVLLRAMAAIAVAYGAYLLLLHPESRVQFSRRGNVPLSSAN